LDGRRRTPVDGFEKKLEVVTQRFIDPSSFLSRVQLGEFRFQQGGLAHVCQSISIDRSHTSPWQAGRGFSSPFSQKPGEIVIKAGWEIKRFKLHAFSAPSFQTQTESTHFHLSTFSPLTRAAVGCRRNGSGKVKKDDERTFSFGPSHVTSGKEPLFAHLLDNGAEYLLSSLLPDYVDS